MQINQPRAMTDHFVEQGMRHAHGGTAAFIAGKIPVQIAPVGQIPRAAIEALDIHDGNADDSAVELFDVERGGDVTFHGPGQLVGYPIVDLKQHKRDLHWYLRQVEQALIDALGILGLPAERNPGLTGVWTSGRKIASIGVHARDWVTWHGFALNVTTDLRYFDLMVPCGIQAVTMTSLDRELPETGVTVDGVADIVAAAFARVFELEAISSSGIAARADLSGV